MTLVIIALLIPSCGLLGYLAVTGAWQWLVATVTSIIAQGPAAIISAVLAGLFTWYCLLPILAGACFIGLSFWLYNS